MGETLIKPIFPEARLEVSTDTGFSTVRFDIFIEKFSIVIEVKCSRPSMTERNLTEEIGSDRGVANISDKPHSKTVIE